MSDNTNPEHRVDIDKQARKYHYHWSARNKDQDARAKQKRRIQPLYAIAWVKTEETINDYEKEAMYQAYHREIHSKEWTLLNCHSPYSVVSSLVGMPIYRFVKHTFKMPFDKEYVQLYAECFDCIDKCIYVVDDNRFYNTSAEAVAYIHQTLKTQHESPDTYYTLPFEIPRSMSLADMSLFARALDDFKDMLTCEPTVVPTQVDKPIFYDQFQKIIDLSKIVDSYDELCRPK